MVCIKFLDESLLSGSNKRSEGRLSNRASLWKHGSCLLSSFQPGKGSRILQPRADLFSPCFHLPSPEEKKASHLPLDIRIPADLHPRPLLYAMSAGLVDSQTDATHSVDDIEAPPGLWHQRNLQFSAIRRYNLARTKMSRYRRYLVRC